MIHCRKSASRYDRATFHARHQRLHLLVTNTVNYHALIQSITALHADSVGRATFAVNQALVLRNWVIGAYIVEFEQNGEDRAEYGDGLLRRLSSDLGACGIKGVSPDMLERMRLFSRYYPQLADSISAPLVRISTKLAANSDRLISAPPVRKSETETPTPLLRNSSFASHGLTWPTSYASTMHGRERSTKSNA
jgi:hypothetical protein